MKKVWITLLIAVMFVSCSQDSVGTNDETYREPETQESSAFADEDAYEVQNTDALDGIVSSTAVIADGKYYFSLYPEKEPTESSYRRAMYIDIADGEMKYLCQAEDCDHLGSKCSAFSSEIYFEWDGKLIGKQYPSSYFAYDPMSGTSESILNLSGFLCCIHDGKLYFSVRDENSSIVPFDLESGEFGESFTVPEGYRKNGWSMFCMDERYAYWHVGGIGYFMTDHQFENIRMIHETEITETDYEWYYDTNTGEMFLLVRHTLSFTSKLYRIHGDEIEEITLPHDGIADVFITRDEIYYTIYDNRVCYGISLTDKQVFDYGGREIYVTDRETHDEAEIFYSCEDMDLPLHGDWIVVGDTVYFDYYPLEKTFDVVKFNHLSGTGKIRINVRDDTIKRFTLE